MRVFGIHFGVWVAENSLKCYNENLTSLKCFFAVYHISPHFIIVFFLFSDRDILVRDLYRVKLSLTNDQWKSFKTNAVPQLSTTQHRKLRSGAFKPPHNTQKQKYKQSSLTCRSFEQMYTMTVVLVQGIWTKKPLILWLEVSTSEIYDVSVLLHYIF